MGGTDIKTGDVLQMLGALEPAQRKAVAANLDALTGLVRRRADQIAVIKEAEAHHWEDDPIAKAAIARARDDALASSYLESIGKVPEGYPSEAETQAAYTQNKDRLVRPAQFELEQLSVARPVGSDKTTADRLLQFVSRLDKTAREKGASLEKIAQSKKNDGFTVAYHNLGFVTVDQVDQALRPLVKSMNIGDVSNVLALPTEYDLLKLHDLKPEIPLRYEEVRDQLVEALRRRKAAEEQQAEMKRIVAATPMAIDQISLGKLIDGNSGISKSPP